MPRTSIEIDFKVDLKHAMFQAAWSHAFREAPTRLNMLFTNANLLETVIIAPAYTITYKLKEGI